MNITVKHNGATITSRVISYQREHRICTGIGTLDITLEGTYATAVEPGDSIDIYENGSFQVRYYVSDATHSVPSGTITLQCQDKSKRLVDYFIPDSYTVDYPSYTRYWIEKFLAEAGISYSFQTSSQGNLLSNYTALGLQPAYDQIMLLLQLSGWYMYFDGNGVAIIGSLNVDLASTADSIGLTDILDIKKVSNDKMLRNRALVWGEYNPFSGYAFADVTRHTRWDYDNRDVRTMVISNQNIPNSGSAYNIANILLKEFARITIEKHIVLEDARSYDLGDALRVRSHVWRGKGLITTFGVNMDRNGLTTSVILDERCPRLFGFFNFGDWVYVGTFGDGVWRKHIKFDHTWYNFSTGLTDLNITDLHINNGMFGAVGHSGAMYYANSEDGPWYEIPAITELLSSEEDDVTGSGVTWVPFSGISARAIIVDKTTNIVKFGVDTWSGLNTGDYFMSYSGIVGALASGVSVSGSSANRGWIVEYDPFTGAIYDDVSSGIYPISYSGNYDIRVLDLENDGKNDYVSVKTGGAVVINHTSYGYNFGKHISQPSTGTQDDDCMVSFAPLSTIDDTLIQLLDSTASLVTVFDNESANEREVVWMDDKFNRATITVPPASATTLSSSAVGLGSALAVVKLGTDQYRAYYTSSSGAGLYNATIKYVDWDAALNTIGAPVTVTSMTVPDDPYHSGAKESSLQTGFTVINGTLRMASCHLVSENHPLGPFPLLDPDYSEKVRNYIEVYTITVDLVAGTGSSGKVYDYEFSPWEAGGKNWSIFKVNSGGFDGYQSGNNFDTSMYVGILNDAFSTPYERIHYLLSSHDHLNYSLTQVQRATSASDPNFMNGVDFSSLAQLTGEHFVTIYGYSAKSLAYVYNGDSVQVATMSSIPWYMDSANIYPLFGAYDNYYIAKNGTDWYFCNPQTLAPDTLFDTPTGYTIIKPYSTTDIISPSYYWQATNADLARVIMKTTETTKIDEIIPGYFAGTSSGRAFICGNFFVNFESGALNIVYLNNAVDVPDRTTGYLVLQRDGADFNLIRSAAKPIRVDISNNSPVLTVLDFENSFQSHFVAENEVTTVIPVSGLSATRQVRDYRYTMLETTSSGVIVGSGAGIQSQILYVTESGVFHSDAAAYSGGFIILDVIASGTPERIETTNYTYPGQYIFVTTSGDNPMFYQRDNETQLFTYYSGLPDSRATIIRCDDRV